MNLQFLHSISIQRGCEYGVFLAHLQQSPVQLIGVILQKRGEVLRSKLPFHAQVQDEHQVDRWRRVPDQLEV